MLNKQAFDKRALIIDIGLDQGHEFFLGVKNGFEVVGLEPNPKSFPKLASRCKETVNCTVIDLDSTLLPLQREKGQSYLINAGAGSKKDFISMSLTGPASTMTLSNPATNPKKKAQVRVERIDSIIREDVYLLKIDTQRFDQFV